MATRDEVLDWCATATKRLKAAAGMATTCGMGRDEILAIVTTEIDTYWASSAATDRRAILASGDEPAAPDQLAA